MLGVTLKVALSCALLAMGIGGTNECGCRLPDNLVPQHYDLEILTHLEANAFGFDGKVAIKVRCVQETDKVILHSKDLQIREDLAKIQDVTGNSTVKIASFAYDQENEFLVIGTEEKLAENGDYVIVIPFRGELKDGLEGFYRSSYLNHETNKKSWVAVTQFEPTDARRAFPCFDEPAMKAIFKISLGRAENYSSISNMPIATTEPIPDTPGYFWDHYEETVPMSTYIVAFAVTDFDFVSSSTKYGTSFRVWARHEAVHQVEFAKTTGPACLEYFEDFFNVSYPLPKEDMIALPDFSAGAMENWGLITFRESALLYDEKTSSAAHKSSIAEVIAHELAHQWFGNLVTMKWWTDLWLNEGFATYMASLAVHHVFPKWNFLTHETVQNVFSVFTKDSLKTSHPVSVTVGNPNEINDIFDTISYSKGSLLLHMMANFLGAETFRKGVSNYLKENKYNNAEQDDLWQALTTQAHLDKTLPTNLTVKTIMDTWTLRTGFPVVTVTRDYEKNSAQLSQERFLRDTIKMTKQASECWWVPITYTSADKLDFEGTHPKTWLSCPKDNDFVYDLPGDDKWVLFNIKASGLYRVNYDEKNWNLLTSTLNSESHESIPTLNKVLLIDDSANLAWVGDLNYTIYFDVLEYLKNERDYLPWQAALTSVEPLNRLLRRTSVYGLFKLYMKELLTPVYHHVGGFKAPENTDNLEDTRHQVQITSWSCKFDVDGCVSEAVKLFKEWQSHPENNSIPKDLRTIVYCVAIRHGGEKEWNFLWKQYQKSNSATEKTTILSALGCSREIWLLQRYLEWSISANSGIRLQDCTSVMQSVASNDVGYYVTRNFVQKSIKEIHKRLATSGRRLGRVIATVAGQMINFPEYKELKQFTETHKELLVENQQAIKQAHETVELNLQWHAKHYEEVKDLLPRYLK